MGQSTHAQEPGWFTTAPVGAMKKLFDRTGWTAKQVDLFETLTDQDLDRKAEENGRVCCPDDAT